jgi:membrane-bound lytic murein transglycosylase F
MQLMPATAHGLGGGNLDSPSRNIALGVKYDGILFEFWKDKVPDSLQAIKFALASYNIGKGHILDARRLAKQYGLDPEVWDDNVEVMIKNLSRSKYYRDPVVKYGYCRGQEAFNYVKRIFYLYDNYKNFESAPS